MKPLAEQFKSLLRGHNHKEDDKDRVDGGGRVGVNLPPGTLTASILVGYLLLVTLIVPVLLGIRLFFGFQALLQIPNDLLFMLFRMPVLLQANSNTTVLYAIGTVLVFGILILVFGTFLHYLYTVQLICQAKEFRRNRSLYQRTSKWFIAVTFLVSMSAFVSQFYFLNMSRMSLFDVFYGGNPATTPVNPYKFEFPSKHESGGNVELFYSHDNEVFTRHRLGYGIVSKLNCCGIYSHLEFKSEELPQLCCGVIEFPADYNWGPITVPPGGFQNKGNCTVTNPDLRTDGCFDKVSVYFEPLEEAGLFGLRMFCHELLFRFIIFVVYPWRF